MTKLADRIATRATPAANAPADPAAATKLAARRSLIRRGEDVELPELGPARMEVLGAVDFEEVEAEMFAIERARNLELNMVTAQNYEVVRARLTLARVTFDRDAPGKPFGTVEEWGDIDVDLINACWQVYGDVRQRLNPMGENTLNDETRRQIGDAVKKKDPVLLRSFGVRALSIWLATTGEPPSTSPNPRSESTE